jgi:hypothetical protein
MGLKGVVPEKQDFWNVFQHGAYRISELTPAVRTQYPGATKREEVNVDLDLCQMFGLPSAWNRFHECYPVFEQLPVWRYIYGSSSNK